MIQENSYYAFGLNMADNQVATPTTPNKNLYNGGAEWQNDYADLPDLQQTFYRNYDAALGRWVGVDPKAEAAESMSSYNYAGNNPVMKNDPMGDLSQAQWQFVLDQYNIGIDGNYKVTDNGVVPYDSDEDAIADNQRGRIYSVNSSGYIHPTNNLSYSNQDVLNAIKTNKSISIEAESLESGYNDSKGFDIYSIKNSDDAFNLFIFLANNTDVEWAVAIGDYQYYLTTSHSSVEEIGSYYALRTILNS